MTSSHHRGTPAKSPSACLSRGSRPCPGLGLRRPSRHRRRPINSWLSSSREIAHQQPLIAPYWDDSHPDHVAASALVDAARFWAKLTKTDLPHEPFYPPRILYYFSVHLRLHPRPSFILDITPYLEEKMRALACYRSQFI